MKRLTFVVLGTALAAAGCTQTLDMEKARVAIDTGIEEQLGLKVSGVTCPETRETKANDTFDCTAAIEGGGEVAVTVSQKDDAGNIEWKANPKNLIDLAALENQVKEGLKAQIGVDAAVTCGGDKFRVSLAGKTFECTARAGDSQAPIIVTMKDDAGNVDWATGPAKQ